MKERTHETLGCLAALAAFSVVLVSMYQYGASDSRDTFEREAVQHGAATWGVSEDGERVFIWLPSAEESRKREASRRADADQILLNEGEARDGE